MKRMIKYLLIIMSIQYLAVCAGVFYFQEKLIFYPQPRNITDEKYTLILQSAGLNIVVSKIERPGDKAILYFGGNAEDVSQSLLALANTLPEYSIYMLHYRGYGGSDGSPGEEGIYQDVKALYRHVSHKHPNISIIGRSLGTGFAVHLASEKPVTSLVLVTPYDSMEHLAQAKLPVLPVSLLLKHKLESYRYAPSVDARTTILQAAVDNLVSHERTQALFEAFSPGHITLKTIENTDHNDIIFNQEYRASLALALSAPSI